MSNNKPMKRCEAAEEYTWKLSDLCASDEIFEKQREEVQASLNKIAAYQGTLSKGAETVLSFLETLEETEQIFETLYAYANMHMHEDMNVTKYQGYSAQMQSLAAQLSASCSFFQPELLSLPEEMLRAYVEDEILSRYRLLLERILKMKPHTLSAAQEPMKWLLLLMIYSACSIMPI